MKPATDLAIELVIDPDCPNVDATRRVLSRALSDAGLPRTWSERVQTAGADPVGDAPDRYPSPTILVDGVEVGEPSRGRGCRIYRDADGRLTGTPSVEQVAERLREARDTLGDGTAEERDGPADACRPGEMSGVGALLGWGVPILAIAIGSFVREIALGLWIPAFVVMGATCLVNVRRCRRVHCYVTGPLFLAMAAFLVAVAAGWAPERWIGPASIAVVVGVGLAYGSELLLGRYRAG